MEKIKTLSIDLETFSDIDLSKCGVYRYVESPAFEILLFGVSVNGGGVVVYDLAQGEKIPNEILAALTDDSVIKWAFNAAFERVCLSKYLGLTSGEYLNSQSWRCSMVWSAYMGLPLSLASAGAVLGLSEQKLKEGKDLIKYFCVPCAATKANGGRTRNLPIHAPEKWAQFKAYNKRDVEVEMSIQDRLRKFPVPDFVWEEYCLDQQINDRGIALDMAVVENAIRFDERSKALLSSKMQELTSLENPNSVQQMKQWLSENGLETDTLGKKPFKRFLGYDRGPDGNLILNPDEAVTVRRIYSMFLQGMSPYGIATHLTADGIKSPGGKDKWNAGAVRSILTNEKYKGDALLQKSYTVDFLTKKKKVNEGEIPQYYVEGNHEAIISPDVYEQVQREMERRKADGGRHSSVHLFSGKIRCGQCGEWYGSKTWHSTSKYRRVIWQCNHKFDGDEKCTTPHLTDDDIKRLFVSAVNQLIGQKDTILTTLTASLDTAFDLTDLKAEQSELESEMTVVSDLMQKCIYENAHVALDQAEYQKRYDGLTARFDTAKARLDAVENTIHSKRSRRAAIEAFLATLKEANLVDTFDTALWCGLVDFVTVHGKDDVRFTFKNGQEIRV